MVPQSAVHRQTIYFTQSSGGDRWVQIRSRWTSRRPCLPCRPLQCACRLLTTSWHASEAGVPKAPSERVICFITPGYVGHDCRACHVHVGQQCAVGNGMGQLTELPVIPKAQSHVLCLCARASMSKLPAPCLQPRARSDQGGACHTHTEAIQLGSGRPTADCKTVTDLTPTYEALPKPAGPGTQKSAAERNMPVPLAKLTLSALRTPWTLRSKRVATLARPSSSSS